MNGFVGLNGWSVNPLHDARFFVNGFVGMNCFFAACMTDFSTHESECLVNGFVGLNCWSDLWEWIGFSTGESIGVLSEWVCGIEWLECQPL